MHWPQGLTGKPSSVLGAVSKALATIATQPLIVAKVGLQSKPPPARKGKPFKSFIEVMQFIIEQEGPLSLFKGIGPQIFKGLLVQGILMMTKERYVGSDMQSQVIQNRLANQVYRVELLFVLFMRYLQSLRSTQLRKVSDMASMAAQHSPLNASKPLATS